jgi:hypothetical protein
MRQNRAPDAMCMQAVGMLAVDIDLVALDEGDLPPPENMALGLDYHRTTATYDGRPAHRILGRWLQGDCTRRHRRALQSCRQGRASSTIVSTTPMDAIAGVGGVTLEKENIYEGSCNGAG